MNYSFPFVSIERVHRFAKIEDYWAGTVTVYCERCLTVARADTVTFSHPDIPLDKLAIEGVYFLEDDGDALITLFVSAKNRKTEKDEGDRNRRLDCRTRKMHVLSRLGILAFDSARASASLLI